MKIYFVRHGESESNAQGIRLGAVAELTDKGREQAKVLARRLKSVPIDCVVVSTMIRAKQTAEIINQVINRPIADYSDLFCERKDPSEFVGQHKDSDFIKAVHNKIDENYTNKDWHYSDEENFYDQKERALKALDYLKNLKQENILVVMHGMFLRMIVACAIFGPKLTPEIFVSLRDSLRTSNSGITILETGKFSSGPVLSNLPEWTLLTWNDHAHLGEIK